MKRKRGGHMFVFSEEKRAKKAKSTMNSLINESAGITALDSSSSEYTNDDLEALGDYGGRDVKKLKSCEGKEADDIVPRRMTYAEMVAAGLIEDKSVISNEELSKLGFTEDDFYGDDGKRDMTDDEDKLYDNAVHESGGYDVPDFPDVDNDGLIQPLHNLDAYIERLTTNINIAIQENVPDLQLLRILKANYQPWQSYYVTFEAQQSTGDIKTYQTKFYVGMPWEKLDVEEFRVKPSN